MEIHRRLWQSFIPRQEVICKYCGKRLLADIDLDKIDYRDETKAVSYTHLDVYKRQRYKFPKGKETEVPDDVAAILSSAKKAFRM